MPSPFPGMDPYIEDPESWPDFHNDLASEIRAELNKTIQPNYFARCKVSLEVPLRLHHVEIRRASTKGLVTVIEILSPVNKRPSHGAYHDYQRNRRDLLRSTVHLLEIDLLRAGERPPLEEPVPVAPYYVMLSREGYRPIVDVWPIQLAEPLPVIPVPLQEPDLDVPLDLGAIVSSVYERGAYASQVDYRQPPPSPVLPEEEVAWLDNLLREQKRR